MAINNTLHSKEVLITCGPTWVPIDDVRVISNRSTGELGNAIACELLKEKARVTLLQGPTTHVLKCTGVRVLKFQFYDELSKLIEHELKKKNYDSVIHAAAVSDYKPLNTYSSKLSSEFSKWKLTLVPTEKIIEKIKKLNPKTFLVGFKLESRMEKKMILLKAQNLIKKANCDLVVANCLSGKNYMAYIIDTERNILAQMTTKQEIAKNLANILREKI